jgi:hypothetical protein
VANAQLAQVTGVSDRKCATRTITNTGIAKAVGPAESTTAIDALRAADVALTVNLKFFFEGG